MKKIILLHLFLSAGNLLFAQTGYFICENFNALPFHSFPILKTTENHIAVFKINTLIQLTELNKIIDTTDKVIFDKLFNTNDSVSYGKTSIDYNILCNTSTIFSVAVSSEWCGASCGHWTNYYNFNSANGDLISLYDLLDKNKISAAANYLQMKRTAHFISQLKNIESNEPVDTLSILEEINNSHLGYFYFRNDSFFIDDEECLSKLEKYLDLNMTTAFSYSELQLYLNKYGTALFKENKKGIDKFRGEHFPQLYIGTTSDARTFYFSYKFYYDTNGEGFIAFTTDGIARLLNGTLENNHFILTENDSDFNDTGFIKADLFKGIITGFYTSADGRTNYTFSAKKM